MQGELHKATLDPIIENRLSIAYRRDTIKSRVTLDGANFGVIATLSIGLLVLWGAWRVKRRLGRRPVLLEWITIVGLSLLESFLSATFTAPLVPRPPIFDEASLYSPQFHSTLHL